RIEFYSVPITDSTVVVRIMRHQQLPRFLPVFRILAVLFQNIPRDLQHFTIRMAGFHTTFQNPAYIILDNGRGDPRGKQQREWLGRALNRSRPGYSEVLFLRRSGAWQAL